jgi:UDP-N-acetylmuramoyl-tripeptide--D-alanyl-D-alanine ligase
VTWHTWILIGASLVSAGAVGLQGVRWLRVLQREHYEASAMGRFFWRWTNVPVAAASKQPSQRLGRTVTLSQLLILLLVVGVVTHAVAIVLGVSVMYGVCCPVGLSIRGRTSRLHWTRRLRTVAMIAALFEAVFVVIASALGLFWLGASLAIWLVPLALSLSTRLVAPYERRQAQGFVDSAARRLAQVRPTVVGITGSYGKTSTKNHLADLLVNDGNVVATPKSFNNRAGLSRAINEGLVEGTRVFIAEMGTYGPGEIADMCAWCPPSLSIITAIGPVHLERMGSLDVIEAAKFEITNSATTIVVNADDPRLVHWPARLSGRRVRTAGTNPSANVHIDVTDSQWRVVVDGVEVARVAPITSAQPTNVACAIAAALELGIAVTDVAERLTNIRPVANRANVVTAPSGVVVIDDTFNANPASARASLALLQGLPVHGRRVVITPGLIELGDDQFTENARLAADITAVGAELVAVQRTNVPALFSGHGPGLRRFEHRDDAVAWVRTTLGEGDAVLYLNDLPDHYP